MTIHKMSPDGEEENIPLPHSYNPVEYTAAAAKSPGQYVIGSLTPPQAYLLT